MSFQADDDPAAMITSDDPTDEEVAAYEAEERLLARYRKRCAERETDSDTNPNEGG